MQAGRLRHRVTIQSDESTTEDDAGHPIPAWTDWLTVWADIDTSSRKFMAAQQIKSQLTHLVTIRYHSAFNTSTKFRIKWGSVYLYPLGPPVDVGQRRERYDIQCAEEVRPA